MARLFIAISLSEEMKKALVACMHDLKKQGVEGNYVPARNLHLTLAFIGAYDDPAKVKKVIEKVPLPQFRLSLSEKGNFGNLLWAGVKGNQKLKTYVRDLRAALREAEIPFDDDKFIPHITLIRKAVAKRSYQVHLGKAEMMVKKVSLMKSEIKNGKEEYRTADEVRKDLEILKTLQQKGAHPQVILDALKEKLKNKTIEIDERLLNQVKCEN